MAWCLVARPCTRRRWLEDGRVLQPDTMRLPPAQVPTRLLHGVADRSVPVAVARDLAARRPDTRLVELEGAGHWPFRTATRATLDTLVLLARETIP